MTNSSNIQDPKKFYELFLKCFCSVWNSPSYFKGKDIIHNEWTCGIEEVIHCMQQKEGHRGIVSWGHHRKRKSETRPEFLCIDHHFYDTSDEEVNLWQLNKSNFPLVSLEHENNGSDRAIIYNFNKLINVLSPLKVLVGYPNDERDKMVLELSKFLRDNDTPVNGKILLIFGTREMLNDVKDFRGYVLYPSGKKINLPNRKRSCKGTLSQL